MKKAVAMLLTCAMVLGMTACGDDGQKVDNNTPNTDNAVVNTDNNGGDDAAVEPETPAGPVELDVVTSFAGGDTNAQNYKDAYQAWEAATGNTVVDMSASSDETWKTRVITDFEVGSEPDVLFFFNGVDANSFIEAGKVVSLDEIRAEYPDFASNMDDGRMPASPVDNKIYAIPVNGFWEAMFVNTTVLDAAGVSMPGPDYTWEAFLADCQKIKDAGYTPIAAALGNIPHYWWDFAIFNHTSPATHLTIPESVDDAQGQAWVAGMEDIKNLYELGYFPENTNSATDDETFQMFIDGKAAFLIDGSWKVGGIVGACQADKEDPSTLDQAKLDQFDVTYVPGMNDRKATDLLGGLSMGYYITRSAWDDPAKREAAVSFVSYMTSDEVVAKFAEHTASALKNTPAVDESTFNSLQIKSMAMIAKSTSFTGAVQDVFNGECRVPTFDGMPEIVTGRVSATDCKEEKGGKDRGNKIR